MKRKVFLIEDEENDYNLIKQVISNDYDLIPNEYQKISDSGIENYLNTPTDENKKKVEDYINANKINIIILDIKLFGDKKGGIKIYDRILLQDETLNKIPVIYLTSRALQSELTLNSNTAYVEKILNSKGFDIHETIKRVKNEIKKFDKVEANKTTDTQWGAINM